MVAIWSADPDAIDEDTVGDCDWVAARDGTTAAIATAAATIFGILFAFFMGRWEDSGNLLQRAINPINDRALLTALD